MFPFIFFNNVVCAKSLSLKNLGSVIKLIQSKRLQYGLSPVAIQVTLSLLPVQYFDVPDIKHNIGHRCLNPLLHILTSVDWGTVKPPSNF